MPPRRRKSNYPDVVKSSSFLAQSTPSLHDFHNDSVHVNKIHSDFPCNSSLKIYTLPVFTILAVIRISAAFLSPIADCDEVYNYWEPLHFLLHAFGFQTWEYSPLFALRSYAYLYPYAILVKLAEYLHSILSTFISPIHNTPPKIFAFYALRCVQAVISALSETWLYAASARCFGIHPASVFLIFNASAPGMFRAAVEFLPSSFAMICLTAAHAAWLEARFATAVFLVAVASLLGWVFAAILAVPLAFYILFYQTLGLYRLTKYALVSGVIVATVMCVIDSWHFGKFILPPLNHIIYNVFPNPNTGSTLYGTEPWAFYLRNLFLNCTLPAILFAIYPIVLLFNIVLHAFLPSTSSQKSHLLQQAWIVSGAYIAFAVFIAQPHKEERFLAPCYPFVALVAAFTLTQLAHFITTFFTKIYVVTNSFSNVIRFAIRLVSSTVIAITILTSLSRIIMQTKAYGAPLTVYTQLSQTLSSNHAHSNLTNVCIGSEWYRFPGSMFIPKSSHKVRFVPTGFSGLLPRPFPTVSATSRWSHLNATRTIQSGFNEFNHAAPDQFYHGSCDYFIDFVHANQSSSESEASHSARISEKSLIVLTEIPFLDNQASPPRLRAFYIPIMRSSLRFGKYRLTRLDP